MTRSSATFDPEGNVQIDLAPEIPDDPRFPAFKRLLDRSIPPGGIDWEPIGTAVWGHWLYARIIVEQFLLLFPNTDVTAEANPWYGRGAELTALVTDQLAAIETAGDVVRDARLVRPAGVR